MKRSFTCLLAILIAGAWSTAALAATTEITASGTGSVALPPDVATVSAVVATQSENAGEAVSQNNARYQRVVSTLEQQGISRGDIALSYYNVGYNPRPPAASSNPPGEIYGFSVNRSFTVKVRNIGQAGRVSDACLAAGATSIDGVTFGLANPGVARKEAAFKAVAEARSNAEAVAAAAGLRIEAIKSIEFGGPVPGPVAMARMATGSAASPTQFDQSTVNVTVSVTAVFLAEP